MHYSQNNLVEIKDKIKNKIKSLQITEYNPKIIAVSKTFHEKDILPLLNDEHCHFGENKVQEALLKWTKLKEKYEKVELHMLGKLQSNKVKQALSIFDYIHSLDNLKLAEKISKEQKKINKKIKIFIQVNIGNENQKSGINKNEIPDFLNKCVNHLDLDIIGLMCLPPNDSKSELYFSDMKKLLIENKLNELSMGMSNDYLKALDFNSTFLRIGSKIFGNRN